MFQKKFSSRLSRQSSKTKPCTKRLVLVSQEPLLYLEFNKPNKQNVSEIKLFKNSTFSSVKITVDTLIDVRNETSKHHFLKSDKINTWPCFPMRIFLSISGHSSELSIANHSSQPTVSQPKCVSDTISNWFENHQPQKTKISTVIYAPFIQNSNQMASRLTATTRFPRVFFNSCNFQGNVQAFRLTGLLWWQKLTWFFQHFLQDFQISQLNSGFAISFIPWGVTLESGLTVAWFYSSNHNSLLWTVTNEIVSFCIDHRLRQMAFFDFAKVGKVVAKAGFRVMLKYFEINKSCMWSNLFSYYIKQIDSMLLCICSVIDQRRRQNVIRTSVTHSATPRVPLFWHHLWSITEQTHGNMESIC